MTTKTIFLGLLTVIIVSCGDYSVTKKSTRHQTNELKEIVTTKPIKALEKDGDIYILFSDNSKKQLTYNKTDRTPILLKNKTQIVFVRDENISGMESKSIMLVNIDDSKERVLTNKKPYYDGLVGTNDIIEVDNFELSLDSNYVLFVTEKYATANQLVKINLKSGKWKEMFSAESFEQIQSKPHYGCFFIAQSALGENGRDIYYRLVDSAGNIIKKFSSKESMNNFRTGIK